MDESQFSRRGAKAKYRLEIRDEGLRVGDWQLAICIKRSTR